jgi:hypothetical protein
MITVQFANGKIFEAESIDDAIEQCLKGGDDPFNPQVIENKKEVAVEEVKPIE